MKIGMESCSSQSEFTPLVNVLEDEVPRAMSRLDDGASQEAERNMHLANDKDEDGEDEVFDSKDENKIESQKKEQ